MTLQDKRGLAEALPASIHNNVFAIIALQQHIAKLPDQNLQQTNKFSQIPATYTAEEQSRDLDKTIRILTEAADRLVTQEEELHARFGISNGPY